MCMIWSAVLERGRFGGIDGTGGWDRSVIDGWRLRAFRLVPIVDILFMLSLNRT